MNISSLILLNSVILKKTSIEPGSLKPDFANNIKANVLIIYTL